MASRHTYRVDVAIEVGIPAAVLFNNIMYWVYKNECNENHYHDGRYWTYNSVKAFEKMYPEMTNMTIRRAMQKLIDSGLVIDGEYNKNKYDRTKWYAIGERGVGYYRDELLDLPNMANATDQNEQLDLIKITNGLDQKNEPIPNIKPNIKPNNNIIVSSLPKGHCSEKPHLENHSLVETTKPKRFTPPTLDEVRAYCKERYNRVDPEAFMDFYTSNGWKVGKNPMRDWKAAVRTWERSERTTTKKREPEVNWA